MQTRKQMDMSRSGRKCGKVQQTFVCRRESRAIRNCDSEGLTCWSYVEHGESSADIVSSTARVGNKNGGGT